MGYDVFISFKRGALDGSGLTRDYELAADLHKTLRENGISAFFSVKDLSTSAFRDEIDNALDDAKVLIAVGTKRENLEAQNVKYEWRSFYDDLLQGFKPEGEIYTYLEGMDQMQLPRALRQRQSFQSNQKEELVRWIKGNLGMAENQPMPKIVLNPQP
ncbi:MAG: toll/interleukin-1 receptor domain-containing protein, partial [Firmicutes bacterium]|nr:toll/interleukin-1 receptor domain-containing protein [Bacillota bacterium]